MCEDSIKVYLEELASNKPAPGGGSASALTGALGAALLEMVCNFTLGKEKFKAAEKDVFRILKESTNVRLRLTELIEEDEAAYLPVAEAYKLPKDTEEQKAIRKQRIQKAEESAKKAPQEVKALCDKLFAFCDELQIKGNPMLADDVRCARQLLSAASKGAENFI